MISRGYWNKQESAFSINSRGRVYDNIFIERLWRTVKYEEVYLHDYRTVSSARFQLSNYFRFYKTGRIPEALGYDTLYEIHFKEPLNYEKQMQVYTR